MSIARTVDSRRPSNVRALSALGCLAAFVFAPGCGDDEGVGADPCDRLCTYEATCFSPCDPDEEPECDPEARYDQIYADCTAACGAGQEERADCAGAAQGYADCVHGRSCGADELDECAEDARRYDELCVSQPGAQVCPMFCTELAVGCTPYPTFGLRGAGCEGQCKIAAAELDCLEALYGFDACSAGSGYACHPLPDDCDDEVAEVQELCEGMAGSSADPDELELCEAIATEQCRCGLWEASDCATLAGNRCLFELGYGASCKSAIEAFDACMQALPTCDRDALHDQCLPEWEAYDAACK